jgi:hypothetical protein
MIQVKLNFSIMQVSAFHWCKHKQNTMCGAAENVVWKSTFRSVIQKIKKSSKAYRYSFLNKQRLKITFVQPGNHPLLSVNLRRSLAKGDSGGGVHLREI